MTPRRFSLLVGRWTDDQARLDRRAGEVVALLYNVHRDAAKSRPATWLDIFPHHRGDTQGTYDEDAALGAFKAWALTHNAILKIQDGVN